MSADVDPNEVIDLLADEYVRAVLDALQGHPRSAPEIARRCGCSEATVYRRLDDLAGAGLVALGTEIDPDGHHRTRYRLRPVRLSVSVRQDGLDGELRHCRGWDDRTLDREHLTPPTSLAD